MVRSRREFAVAATVSVLLALLIGWLLAGRLSGFLAIEFTDKEIPDEIPTLVETFDVDPVAPLGSVDLSDAEDPLLSTASEFLADAVGTREEAGAAVNVTVEISPDPEVHPEGYAIDVSGESITVTAADRRGAGQGLFRLADAIASGRDWSDAATDGVIEPVLEDRFVDTGAVGVQPDADAYRAQDDYQHSSGALEHVVLADAPYIDAGTLALAETDWREFIDHVASYGYNGVVIPGFLEYVNFDSLGDGYQIYDADSPYRARHEAMKEDVGAMWRYAHDMGLKVIFKTDMVALTGPLEDYLQRETGLDPADPHLWEVYRAGIDELLTDFDWADGLMIRIGEAGSIYNHEGWDYYSELDVTNAADVRTMLTAASEAAAEHDATIYFRSWSVGVGDVGDMHTNPETYDRLMDEVDLDNLVVSTKFVMGDFDSFLPLNPTFATGDENRLVELQGRREFEAFSSIPNDVGPAHQNALQTFLAEHEGDGGVTGLWMWTQDGGPWRAGPMSLYLKEGLWELYDLNVYTGGRLGWDPDTDLGVATGDWIRRTFTTDPEAVDTVGHILRTSRVAVLEGLYIGPYAEQQVFALGLEPPPMMWIFKWDIVSGDSAALSAVYHATRGHVDEAIEMGEWAAGIAEQLRATFEQVPASAFHDPDTYAAFAESLDYQVDLYRTLQSFRVLFLRYYEWLDTGSSEAYDAYRAAIPEYREAVAAHEERWTGDLDFPPYNFFAADVGVAHAERNPVMRTVSWGVLAVCLLGLALVPALRAAAFTPWRLREAAPDPVRRDRLLVIGLPIAVLLASRVALSGALSWLYPIVTLGSIALLALAVRAVLAWLRPGADAFWLWAALGGVLLVRTTILSAALSIRGPGAYWYRFWTDDAIRGAYVTVAFAAFCYGFVVVVITLATAYGLRIRQGLGAVLVGVGAPLIAVGAVLWVVGLEDALTTINDELALLPLGLSRILGLTVHLGIPSSLPGWLMQAGLLSALFGALFAWRGRSAAVTAPVAP